MRWLSACLALSAGLAGCAAPQAGALLASRAAVVPATSGSPATTLPARDDRLVHRVPFFAQSDYQCGPAALAMAAVDAGVPTTPQALVPLVWLPERNGALQAEMLAGARRLGLAPTLIGPRLADVLAEIAAGHPVVVLQNLSLAAAPIWHYAVAVGYDLDRETITLHSGLTPALEMSLHAFERTWMRGDGWAFVALPPSRLPATAREDAFVAAVAGLERTQPSAAAAGYEAALRKWPDSRIALLGVGNVSYAKGDRTAAAAAWSRAVEQDARFADAWNNLAHVLGELGRHDEALAAADRAVAIGGPRAADYAKTRDGLMQRR